MHFSFLQKLGCWLYERWRFEVCLCRFKWFASRQPWQSLRNRHESVITGDDAESYCCNWNDSSWLTVAQVFPSCGARLLKHLRDNNEKSAYQSPKQCELPKISVILPVCGRNRQKQFACVLNTFLVQYGVSYEILVAEFGVESLYQNSLPQGVNYLWVPACENEDFNKSKVMNSAVRVAQADIVLLHDADVAVPEHFLFNIVQRMNRGYEALKPMRFIFHLDEPSSELFYQGNTESICDISTVQQNNPGISTACLKETYWEIGGHDERFEGWGGEDNEFLDRLKTRKLWQGGYTYGVHLWHPPARKKASGDRNVSQMLTIREVDVAERIEGLRNLSHGCTRILHG